MISIAAISLLLCWPRVHRPSRQPLDRSTDGLVNPEIRQDNPPIPHHRDPVGSEIQFGFALGACGGLGRILMPSAVNTASEELVNWPARSLIRNLTVAARAPRSIRTLRAAWVVQAPSGFAVMPARWT